MQCVQKQSVISNTIAGSDTVDKKIYRTKFFYNSTVSPRAIDALFAKKPPVHHNNASHIVRSRTVLPSVRSGDSKVLQTRDTNVVSNKECIILKQDMETCESKSHPVCAVDRGGQVGCSASKSSANAVAVPRTTIESHNNGLALLYDTQLAGIEDKFVNTIISGIKTKQSPNSLFNESDIYKDWEKQSDFKFGFIPHSAQVMPSEDHVCSPEGRSVFNIRALVRATGVPNYMQARIPVSSQLNVDVWKNALNNYWDQQLLQLIEFGFPLDFNRNCVLNHEEGNHSSATEFPSDIDAYLQEECSFNAILGPFESNPIPGAHTFPFMTRHKPNSERRRVIIDLSWPLGASVNAGIDKQTYLGSEFELTFPSVDDITNELKRLGRGARLYKVDVSHAFRHVKVDPGDYDLLRLHWRGAYVDTCLPFGTRHGSQIFQRLSFSSGFCVIDYIDDYVSVGIPGVAHDSYNYLVELMRQLGLTISEKKLVPPSTQVVCLGVLIDTERGSISIPDDKLTQICDTVKQWQGKRVCTKRQLQSILGQMCKTSPCLPKQNVGVTTSQSQ